MSDARLVAKHLIHLSSQGVDSAPMTALRLHKLLYDCQGWYSAWYGKPLFPEAIEAWPKGPVVPQVYREPWGKGDGPLTEPAVAGELPERERDAVDQVWAHYRRFTPEQLSDATHDEAPWKDHFDPQFEHGTTIPVEEIDRYFATEYHRLTGDRPGTWGAESAVPVPLESLPQVLGW